MEGQAAALSYLGHGPLAISTVTCSPATPPPECRPHLLGGGSLTSQAVNLLHMHDVIDGVVPIRDLLHHEGDPKLVA